MTDDTTYAVALAEGGREGRCPSRTLPGVFGAR
jgi:hypothetical protein